MQAAPRRVKTIYSVIASPQRLEILRILNIKGPLTYSALKTLAGFKSKKESGKFAYHLRKLVKQLLIQLNRQERKYTVTNLGRLVLNLTRQIEEQSLVESGKLYVRTSHQTMEEFNANKILQSLVKEAGMPVELAQKITSETESRLYKFQTQYLTAPLIREIVNALLVEHSMEEYRHKLTRLGMPIYDVTQLLGKASDDGGNVESLVHQTGKQVFSEYLLLEQLPRDVADAHLSGDIHIANAGSWGLTPDTVFVDLLSVRNSGMNPRGKILNTAMIPSPENAERALNIVLNMSAMLTKETSDEVSFRNFLQYLSPFCKSRGKRELESLFLRFFEGVSSPIAGAEGPAISIELNPYRHDDVGRDVLDKTQDAVLAAYRNFVEETPRPDVRLLLAKPNRVDETKTLKDAASIIFNGGRIAFFSSDERRSFLGLNANVLPQELQADNVSVLHGLSLNLPRLAYDSNQDETYFRAKLALLIGVSADALSTRRRLIERTLKRGLLPSLAAGSDAVTSDTMPLMMNLVGLEETLASLIRDPGMGSRTELAEKIVETAGQVANDKSTRIDRLAVAMLDLDGALRLATLDSEKYGKANLQALQKGAYTQAPRLVLADLESPDRMNYMTKLAAGLRGGLSVTLDGNANDIRGVYNMILNATPKLPYFKVDRTISVCKNCGAKLPQNAARCRKCKSVATMQYSTAV
ncbi:MAG TPA: anaerobic ribonucleoside-triphosphate reductase [Nitrososphaerales archaeon]|nr:anaerobic ribonucleoside-triphosphate reductase [Nitrososphaerales archaeon]